MREFILGMFAGALALGVGQVYNGAPATVQPRLIAQGCEGAGGDLWAMDKSDFPTQCEHIERWRP